MDIGNIEKFETETFKKIYEQVLEDFKKRFFNN